MSSSTALNRTSVAMLTNKSGGNLVYGDVVVLDNTNANGFTTTTTAGLSTRGIGVIIDIAGIANNATGRVAVGGWVPQVNLNAAATVGQFLQTFTVAGQATPHSSPQIEGDFAVALGSGSSPAAVLFGSPNGPTGSVSDGDKGDITVSGGGAAWAIDAKAVTYAKIQDVSATSRILARKTAGSGVVEEATLSEVLDFIGSAAHGDILYRDSAAWARLAAGSSGQFLRTAGSGADPAWASTHLLTQLIRSTDQSITNATWTEVSWSSALQDDVSAFSGGSPTLVTVPSGFTKVRVLVYCNWENNSTGARYARLTHNGTATVLEFDVRGAVNESGGHWTTRWRTVAPTDTLRIMVNQTSGGNLNLSGGAFGGNSYVQFEWAP